MRRAAHRRTRDDWLVDLNGRVALVTGAGQGVGRQVALDLARNGAAGVVVNDYFEDRAGAVAKEIEEEGLRALAIAADVTSLSDVMAVRCWTGCTKA